MSVSAPAVAAIRDVTALVGNDFTHRSLVFYLAKPIRRWHYLLGKCLAVAAVVGGDVGDLER